MSRKKRKKQSYSERYSQDKTPVRASKTENGSSFGKTRDDISNCLNTKVSEQEEQKRQLLLNNRLLLEQLHTTQEELIYHRTHVSPKFMNQHRPRKSKVYYGAGGRVEEGLPYKLGRLINKNIKTPQGIIKLPKLLITTYNKLPEEQEKQQNLPPLESYIDIEEAEKVKKHLNYRIGLAVAETMESPKKIFTLPLEVIKQIYLFRKSRF